MSIMLASSMANGKKKKVCGKRKSPSLKADVRKEGGGTQNPPKKTEDEKMQITGWVVISSVIISARLLFIWGGGRRKDAISLMFSHKRMQRGYKGQVCVCERERVCLCM